MNLKKHSKFLSLLLRHRPEELDLNLDLNGGWVSVDDLLRKLHSNDPGFTREVLDRVVAENNKKRFEFSEDGNKIRASQGHSLPVVLEYIPVAPPRVLFHGTSTRNLDSIFEQGLLKMNRQHVHLSVDPETARNVGSRHGTPIVISVRAWEMHDAGHEFFLSTNKVWLTETVPVSFLTLTGD